MQYGKLVDSCTHHMLNHILLEPISTSPWIRKTKLLEFIVSDPFSLICALKCSHRELTRPRAVELLVLFQFDFILGRIVNDEILRRPSFRQILPHPFQFQTKRFDVSSNNKCSTYHWKSKHTLLFTVFFSFGDLIFTFYLLRVSRV